MNMSMQAFKKLFLDHPASVDESYFEHLVFAFRFAGRLFRIGLAALIHGAIPAMFETTASSEVLALSEEIGGRRRQMAENNARLGASRPAA
jgi:hypothetical protein